MINRITISNKTLTALATLAALAACAQQPVDGDGQNDEQPTEPAPSSESSETISILRTEIEGTQPEKPALETLEVVVGFPDGGADLDEAALATLRAMVASEQIALNGPIILRAHSDAGGSDSVNMRVTTRRANAVKDWLIENGVDPSRVQTIAFGEQNPIEPNALPDGSPNEAGRAANRRVEIEIPAIVLTAQNTAQAEQEPTASEAGD